MISHNRVRQRTRDFLRKQRSNNYPTGRDRSYKKSVFSISKAKGVVQRTKAAKAVLGVSQHIRMKGPPAKASIPHIQWKRHYMNPSDTHDYYPLHDYKGDQYAFLYDFNVYSVDGAAWLASMNYVRDWNLWIAHK